MTEMMNFVEPLVPGGRIDSPPPHFGLHGPFHGSSGDPRAVGSG